MSSIPFTNTAFPPLPDRPDPVVLDVHTIAVVLYLAPFTPADWRLMGPTQVGRFVTSVAADPRCRIPDVVALFNAAEQAGQLGHIAHLTDARRYARRVLAALSN